jgi:hypothetical protein
MGYILIMFTHRAHSCERACARARVIKSSIIFGRILIKFAVNILHITTSSTGCVLLMFTNRVHACERVFKSSLIYGRILFTFAANILPSTTNSMGYVLFIFTHCAHALNIRLSLDGLSSNLLGTYYK